MTGRLIGIGLGPGDPDLLTLKAHRILSKARIVAYPAPLGGESFARSIVADFLPPAAREIRIDIPMDARRFPAQDAYDKAAGTIAAELRAGTDVVVLCEGDPFFYGSFMYLFARLRDVAEVEVVPGVTSLTACAGALHHPLSARNEVLTILPATLPEDALDAQVARADALAIMKVGRNLAKVRRVLSARGLEDGARYISHATLDAQVMAPLAQAPEKAPYFSMILVRKGGDPWLS